MPLDGRLGQSAPLPERPMDYCPVASVRILDRDGGLLRTGGFPLRRWRALSQGNDGLQSLPPPSQAGGPQEIGSSAGWSSSSWSTGSKPRRRRRSLWSHAREIVNRIRGLVAKSPPRKDWVDVNKTIEEGIEIQRHDISLVTHLSTDLPLIRGDRT